MRKLVLMIKNRCITYFKNVKSNPRGVFSFENRVTSAAIIVILLLLCSGAVFAFKINKRTKKIEQKVVQDQMEASPSATISPTITPSVIITQTASTITSTPTPNNSLASYTIKAVSYPDHNLLPVSTKISIHGALYNKEVDDARDITFSDIPPGDYTIEVNTPSGYRFVEVSDCGISGKCQAVGNDCSRAFTIKAGEHGNGYCSYEKYSNGESLNNGKPEFSISYPGEGQSITFTSPDQKLCVVTIPGKNTSGAVIYYNYNNTGWTTSCFVPQEGSNTVQVKIKNGDNVESDIQSRSFVFHKGY